MSMIDIYDLPLETDSPPQEFADCYERVRYDDDKFRLRAAARDYVRERESELRAMEAQAAADLAAERTAHENSKRQLRERIIDSALDQALAANGANARTRPGAVALLKKVWEFSISDHDGVQVVAVKSGDAEQNISQAIEHWLCTDGGQAFSMRRPSTTAFDRIKQTIR
jgi:hypothetical protein